MTDRLFNSKYPIMEALMNGGSDLALALAVADAGAFPSYWYQGNTDKLYQDLKEFKKCTGHSNIVVGGISNHYLTQLDILQVLVDLKISHVEILVSDYQTGNILPITQVFSNPKAKAGIKFLKKTSKILTRIYEPTQSPILTYFDGLCVKGKESAGKTSEFSVSELFDKQLSLSHNCLIPYGGIGSPAQVKDYIQRGAPVVAVGTMLAASAESSLSTPAKQKLIQSTCHDLVKLSDTKQNSLVLDCAFKDSVPATPNDWNRQNYLEQGLRGNGHQGLMYVGSSVNYITEIKPVKDIIEYLVSELTT